MQDQRKLREEERRRRRKLREYYVWSLRRSSKESRMEGKAGGEGQTERVSKEELFSFRISFSFIALLVFCLAVLVYKFIV